MRDNLGLAKYVLPEELLQYFDITKIAQKGRYLHMYLKELNEVPAGYDRSSLASKGFHNETVIKDFPIRDKPVFLHILRRRWLEKATGKTVSRDWKLVAEGTHYTQEFAFFLKEFIGYLPDRHVFP